MEEEEEEQEIELRLIIASLDEGNKFLHPKHPF
jgi:hypothetical protein